MKIHYNTEEKAIVIQDNEKAGTLLISFSMILNAVAATLTYFSNHESSLISFWAMLGIISMGVLVVILFKRSIANVIPLEQIKYLKERNVWGERKFILKLKNGRDRYLSYVKKPTDVEDLKRKFSEWGVKVV